MARIINEERRVLTESLHTVLVIKELFKRHMCEWMARSPGKFSEEMTREFYASYTVTIQNAISKRAKPVAQYLLQVTLVWNFSIDISETTICRFIYSPAHNLSINTMEYDYMMGVVQSGAFQRDVEQRETLLQWMASHITDEGERTKWVCHIILPIRMATMSFTAKFFWTIVYTRLSRTQANNMVTWDKVVMVATLVAGLELDFARIFIAEIHERAFKTTTTLPFLCLIFHLCRAAGVPIWHCDSLL
uniref:Integrase core domain containing protein n=1 Tax=Solanum tuberosum TaxID=4113 RepID=M1DS47_SOLTU